MMNLIKAGWPVGILLISIIKEKNNQNPETRTRKELLCPPLLKIFTNHCAINSSPTSIEALANTTTKRKMKRYADTARRRTYTDALLIAKELSHYPIHRYPTFLPATTFII
jgi:hypothetical protein